MKKLFFIFTVLFSLVSNSFAQSAPQAYIWEVEYIASDNYPYWEDVYGNQTITQQDHGGNIYIAVLIVGYSSTIVTTFNNQPLQPYHIQGIDANGDGSFDAWRYYYKTYGQSGYVQINDFGIKDSIFIK